METAQKPITQGLSDEHAAKRRGLATSTVAPGALNKGFDTPYMTWLKIKGRAPKESERKPQLERGTVLQHVIFQWLADKLDLDWQEPEFVVGPEGWTGDSADMILSDKATGEIVAIGEAKTVAQGAAEKWGTPGTDEVPDYVLIQAHWHLMHHPSVSICYVPVLFGGYRFEFQLYKVERDEAFEAKLLERVRAWWTQHVEADVAPPFVAEDKDYLDAKHPKADEGTILDPSDDLVEAVGVRLKYQPIADKAQGLVDAANNRIRDIMGSAHKSQHENFSVSWGNVKGSKKVDWETIAQHIAKEHGVDPDALSAMVAQNTRVSPGYRKLTVTGRGAWKVVKK